MRFLLDTNLISEPIKPIPDEAALRWMEPEGGEFFVSAITIGELKKGIARLPAGKRKERFDLWLKGVLAHFENRILPFDHQVALVWGAMYAQAQENGYNLPALDSMIAAIAFHHDLVLATRNERDFEGTGVRTANPWTWPKAS